ncbi:MAG: group III truncated hemoglobin [Alphaproteobacteria bacterium]|nr:group III truncated hemoglobin [Alphaproteobacteria bacterium]
MAEHPEDGPERRSLLTRDVTERTGIDEAMVRQLVHAFYDKVRADALLGPVFAARIADWGPHLAKMCDFWSSVALMTGRYHGRPMPAHIALGLSAGHFDRWLALFAETAREVCPPAAAAHFVERAHRIAESFELGIAIQKGELPPRRRRSLPDWMDQRGAGIATS